MNMEHMKYAESAQEWYVKIKIFGSKGKKVTGG